MTIACVILGLALIHIQSVRAGWSGVMNGTGYGWASASLSHSPYYTSVNSGTKQNPSASNPGTLPPGASFYTFARASGSPGYIWSASTQAYYGDGADNAEVESRVQINPANCPSLETGGVAEQSLSVDEGSGLSSISVNANGTAGTGLLLRGYKFVGLIEDHIVVPPDNPDTPESETVEAVKAFLKAHGELKFEWVGKGPFEYGFNGNCPLVLQFDDTAPEDLYFVTDAVAKSTPLEVTCPADMVVECGQRVTYPDVQYSGGCGTVIPTLTATYSPAATSLQVGENLVTVTITDDPDHQNVIHTCTFKVTVQALAFDGFFSPIDGIGGSCEAPLRRLKAGSKLPVKFKVTCDGSDVITGAPTLSIRQCSGGTYTGGGDFQLVGNEWHFNWDTPGRSKGVYELIATLQDGSKKTVFIALKSGSTGDE
ncbi:MAG: PxKF domain-containing protein [Verrucomicrobiales bacterium]|nr:PxKF domain-containing protein [Verrucomicrobiales bacterium]